LIIYQPCFNSNHNSSGFEKAGTRYTAVGMETRSIAGPPRNRGSSLLSPNCPDRLWAPPRCWAHFLQG